MIIVLNCFRTSFYIQKPMSQFIKDTYISEKKYQNVHNLQDKHGCKKYVSVTAIAKLMPANLSILITTNFKNQNLSKAKDKVF